MHRQIVSSAPEGSIYYHETDPAAFNVGDLITCPSEHPHAPTAKYQIIKKTNHSLIAKAVETNGDHFPPPAQITIDFTALHAWTKVKN